MDPAPNTWPCIGRTFHLDSNRVNARGHLVAVTELETWAERGVISLEWSEPVYEELHRGAPRGPRARKARGRLVVHPHADTPAEQAHLSAIERVVFPEGVRSANERTDLLALFSAYKYAASFVTDDGSGGKARGILSHRRALAGLGVKVLTDVEAVALVRERVALFAHNERELARLGFQPAGSWVAEWEALYPGSV